MGKKKGKEWNDWVNSKPEAIQKLIVKYPPGEYLIKEGAPYGVSCPGTTVHLHGYQDNGEVAVIVLAVDKKPEAISHETLLGIEHGRTQEEMMDIHSKDIMVFIDPQWMELMKEA